MGHKENNAKTKIHSCECLHEEAGENTCYQLNHMPEIFKKETNTQRSRRKEIFQLRAEANQIEGEITR